MIPFIQCLTQSLSLGSPLTFKNIGVVPILGKTKPVISYISLSEALAAKLIVVTELSQGGSVPELKVRNESNTAVLALDGEELEGAKQNRVLNTSILLRKKFETVIPVSCTEQGRWSYNSPTFHDSGNILFRSARASKSVAVSESLDYSKRFDSNQGEIWNSISSLHRQAGTHSSTGAMKDFFDEKGISFVDYLKALPCQPGQQGIMVFLDGVVIGFDYVSLESAYKALHVKLLKSYAVESILTEKTKEYPISTNMASEYLDKLKETTETKFKSPGHGWDHRFSGKGVVGSALAYRGQAVHAAFFSTGNGKAESPMSSYRYRAGFRNF